MGCSCACAPLTAPSLEAAASSLGEPPLPGPTTVRVCALWEGVPILWACLHLQVGRGSGCEGGPLRHNGNEEPCVQ